MIHEPSDQQRFDEVGGELEAAIQKRQQQPHRRIEDDDPQRVRVRKRLLSSADPLAYERVIGTRNLLGIHYLAAGVQASRPVGQIRIRADEGPDGYATGFLVAPGLLLTNRHVLKNADVADRSFVAFDHALDEHDVALQERVFDLSPRELFFADPDLDFAFVAVEARDTLGTPLSTFGFLPLIPTTGKALDGEAVTIIQHPGGGPKQVVVRENEVVKLPDRHRRGKLSGFIHYTADTERGSSGSPVFNDQWQVVALHHLAIAKRDKDGRVLNRDGLPWTPDQGDAARAWLANEGVRISSIFRVLSRETRRDPRARAVLSRLLNTGRSPGFGRQQPLRSSPVADVGEDAPPFEADRFEGASGYDPSFLSVAVPRPGPSVDLELDATRRSDDQGIWLDYHNFSVVMSSSRRLAICSVVNIDGAKLVKTSDDKSWRTDRRIPKDTQSDNLLYKYNPLDRGHLVRRLDPVWGTDWEKALADTFHYTNAAPQEHGFNDGIWGELEDFILYRARDTDHRVTVFSGPIFRDTDPYYGSDREGGPYQLPEHYWKVVVFVDEHGEPVASAYLLTQADAIAPLIEAMTAEDATTHQIPITTLEAETGLDFGSLRDHDTYPEQEATGQAREIQSREDLLLRGPARENR